MKILLKYFGISVELKFNELFKIKTYARNIEIQLAFEKKFKSCEKKKTFILLSLNFIKPKHVTPLRQYWSG